MKLKAKLLCSSFPAFIVLAGIVLLSSCEKYSYVTEVINPVDTVHFQTQIQPIFTSNCIVCHKGSRNPDLREGNSYASLRTGGYVNLPAETSRLYRQITSSSHYSYTLPAEKQLILIWIQQGALNN
jgi:hypothetical protein